MSLGNCRLLRLFLVVLLLAQVLLQAHVPIFQIAFRVPNVLRGLLRSRGHAAVRSERSGSNVCLPRLYVLLKAQRWHSTEDYLLTRELDTIKSEENRSGNVGNDKDNARMSGMEALAILRTFVRFRPVSPDFHSSL